MLKRPADPVIGHVCAVLVASAVFTLLAIAIKVGYRVFGPAHLGIEWLSYQSVLALELFLILVLGVGFVASIPVFAAHHIARRMAITSVWYYVTCGAVTGFVLSVPLLLLILGDPYTRETQPVVLRVLYFGHVSLLSGAVGGLAYWLLTGRFVGRPEFADHGE